MALCQTFQAIQRCAIKITFSLLICTSLYSSAILSDKEYIPCDSFTKNPSSIYGFRTVLLSPASSTCLVMIMPRRICNIFYDLKCCIHTITPLSFDINIPWYIFKVRRYINIYFALSDRVYSGYRDDPRKYEARRKFKSIYRCQNCINFCLLNLDICIYMQVNPIIYLFSKYKYQADSHSY